MNKLLSVVVSLLVAGCFAVGYREDYSEKALAERRDVDVPSRIHLKDGSVLICQEGFTYDGEIIAAKSVWHDPTRTVSEERDARVAMTEILGVEVYDTKIPILRVPADLVMIAAIGSCPTVYAVEDERDRLVGESFSFSVGRQFEMADLDRIGPWNSPTLIMKLKNEMMETHYIDKFALVSAGHRRDQEAYPTDDQRVVAVSDIRAPISVRNTDGSDITGLVGTADDRFYACDSASLVRMVQSDLRDRLECRFLVPHGVKEATLIFRVRNSLLTTTLLYDVMLRDQGFSALDWTRDVNSNMLYAWKMGLWYRQFSGIQVEESANGSSTHRGKIFNSGPLAWKEIALPIELTGLSDTVDLHLEYLLDNWQFDRVSLAVGPPDFLECKVLPLRNVADLPVGLVPEMSEDNDEYAVTYPGSMLQLEYQVPLTTEGATTLFVLAEGYYTEWLRPEWLQHGERSPIAFEVSDDEEPIRRALRYWSVVKGAMEASFALTRFGPSKGGH